MSRDNRKVSSDWISRSQSKDGVERIEAFLHGNAYSMHRHDTYAIGLTLSGVQCFHYRRSLRSSTPGQAIVLHPDEAHDGQAGTSDGFRYQMIYVQPAAIQEVLGGKSLPFVEGGVTNDRRLFEAAKTALRQMGGDAEALERDDALVGLALALDSVSGAKSARKSVDFATVQCAREYLYASSHRAITLDELALACGRDRWSLSRDFRTFYGTSPYRYLVMRRLEVARTMMLRGVSLAETAAAAGFADQSHMTRHFCRAYGMPPARWLAMMDNRRRG